MNEEKPLIETAEIPPGHAYCFTEWDMNFENNKSRKIHQLTYFQQPIKLEGECLGYMLMQEDGLELYGVLTFLKIVASRGRPHERGWLARNGTGLTATRIACQARIPAEKIPQIQRALEFFSTPPMDWLKLCPLPTDGDGHLEDTSRSSDGHLEDTAWAGQGQGRGRAPQGHFKGTSKPRLTYLLRGKTEVKREEEAPFSEIASDALVRQFAAEWPGEPASGAGRMPVEYVDGWLKQMNGRTLGWPKNWKRSLISSWRVDFKTWRPGGPASARKGVARQREGWQIEKELASLREQIRLHPSRTWPANRARDKAVDAELEGLKKRRAALEKELRGLKD